jgi:hypothetical protein
VQTDGRYEQTVSPGARCANGTVKTALADPKPRIIGRVLLFLHAGVPASSQTPPTQSHDPLNRDNPQSSVFSFLEACHSQNYARAWRYLDLRALPEDQRSRNGTQLARQLSRILDRDARFDIGALSHDANGDEKDGLPPNVVVVDTFAPPGQSLQLQLQRVTLRPGLKVWLFSSQSIELVPKLAVLTSDSPIEKHMPPELVNWTFLDTSLWRLLALLLVVIVLTAASRWLSRLAVFLADRVVNRLVPGLDGRALKSFVGPFQLLFPVAVLRTMLVPIGPRHCFGSRWNVVSRSCCCWGSPGCAPESRMSSLPTSEVY